MPEPDNNKPRRYAVFERTGERGSKQVGDKTFASFEEASKHARGIEYEGPWPLFIHRMKKHKPRKREKQKVV